MGPSLPLSLDQSELASAAQPLSQQPIKSQPFASALLSGTRGLSETWLLPEHLLLLVNEGQTTKSTSDTWFCPLVEKDHTTDLPWFRLSGTQWWRRNTMSKQRFCVSDVYFDEESSIVVRYSRDLLVIVSPKFCIFLRNISQLKKQLMRIVSWIHRPVRPVVTIH